MSLITQRHAGRNIEDPASREHSVHSDISSPQLAPVELIVPAAGIDDSSLDERAYMALKRKFERARGLGGGSGSGKTASEWIKWCAILAAMLSLIIPTWLVYSQLAPILHDVNSLTSMAVKHQPAIEKTLLDVMNMVNGTSADLVYRYGNVVERASKAVDHVEDLLNDPQTQRNIQVLTEGISKGNFERIGRLINIALKVTGAITQSAGDNGITLNVGNWKAYVNETDIRIND